MKPDYGVGSFGVWGVIQGDIRQNETDGIRKRYYSGAGAEAVAVVSGLCWYFA
jgi:hypothetical protein